MPRIIDDKGRLFGKINIIDFIVLLFILSVIIPGFYFGWKIFRQPKIVEVQIDWEAKYKEALVGCEQRRAQDLEGWQKRYEGLQGKIDNFLKKNSWAIKYFN